MRAPRRWSIVKHSGAAFVLWIAASSIAGGAENPWERAEEAYARDEFEIGHATLKGLIASRPGDEALAARSLARMLGEVRRQRWHHRLLPRENPWGRWAAERYCALEGRGVVSTHSKLMRLAVDLVVDGSLAQGQPLQAHDLVARLRKENPHDLYWQLSEAEFFRQLRAPGTTLLYQELEAALGGLGPEETVRERLATNDREHRNWRLELKPPLRDVGERISLSLIDGTQVSQEWEDLVAAPPQARAEGIHRMLTRGTAIDLLPWSDERGSIDLPHLLDRYLQQKGSPEVAALRRIQNRQSLAEEFASTLSESETLSLVRRYPWARESQEVLLALGNRYLWAGQAQAAGRCFQEVLNRAIPGAPLSLSKGLVRKQARVGLLTAKVQAGVFTQTDQILSGVKPGELLPWYGKRVSAASLARELLAGRRVPTRVRSESNLSDLTTRVLSLAEPSLWPGQLPATVDLQWMPGDRLLVSGRTILSLFAQSNLSTPIWSTPQPLRGHGANFHPGYFRPTQVEGVLYLRTGDELMPNSITAIDLETGRPKWTDDFSGLEKSGRSIIPLADPVFADGHLFALHWNTQRGRSLSLACYDPREQQLRWLKTLVVASGKEDRDDNLRRASPHRVVFGNRVSVHDGASYSVSNCGVVARSDIRDGRTEWIHNYDSTASPEPRVGKLGAAPLVVDDLVICMPRDSRSVFALGLETGRRGWENSLVSGAELIGQVEDLIVVRGQGIIAGLESKTGTTRWHRPIDRVVGRCQLVESSIYLGQSDRLLRIDARNGASLGATSWGLGAEQVLAFTVRDGNLIVVTDRLSNKRASPLRQAMESHGPVRPEVLLGQWMEGLHSVRTKLPQGGSALHGLGYGHSPGLLQCFDVRVGGGLRWQRRMDAWSPEFHFVGTRLLVIDRVNGHLRGLPNRIRAYDGRTGEPLWASQVPSELDRVIPQGEVVLFFRENRRLMAMDGRTGQNLWERRFGPQQTMRLHPGDERIDLVVVSRVRTVSHLALDLLTGRTLQEHRLSIPRLEKGPSGATEAAGGYLAVATATVRGRYVRLVALSEVNNHDYTTIADLQVLGGDGEPLARDRWRVHFVDSCANSGFEDPENAIDEDLVTWWHTPWNERDHPHPHEIQLDLGEEDVAISGIRYLPATIANSKGMIKEFELYVAKKPGIWGKPLARGTMSARPQVIGIHSREHGVAFEAHCQSTNTRSVLHYRMDGERMRIVRAHGRISHQSKDYYVSNKLDDQTGSHFVVHRFDDPSYRLDLGPMPKEKSSGLKVEGARLTMGPQGAVEIDLVGKRFLKK